ncbi:hypothetical protein [Maridesulfovibrio sp.]|uniref:hypothetical protein n=1 Tax=Maridesulfovibrio sp. TaxID=2795000 RepID=UPI0029CA4C69|nr:hypothetical protein [Maridesulfovibrio sp.]
MSNEKTSLIERLRNDKSKNKYDPTCYDFIVRQTMQRLGAPLVRFKPHVPYLINDPLFVFRGDPRYIFHDPLGYKNDALKQRPQIIVLGNSQVHSLSCPPNQTWPGLLQNSSGIGTYNAAMGSFSIVQNFLSARELASLKPDLMICVFYTSNNVINSLPTLRKSTSALKKMFNSYDDTVSMSFQNPDVDPFASVSPKDKIMEFMKLAKYEKEHYVTATIDKLIHFSVPAIRSNSQNLKDPYVEVGFNLAKEALLKIKKIADKHTKYGLFLMIMPTKEFVLYNRLLSYGDVKFSSDREMSILYENESEVITSLKKHCDKEGMHILDPLSYLINTMHLPIYNPLNVDGHPSLEGRTVLAKYVYDFLGKYQVQ